MLGVNAYPCNSGLLIHETDSEFSMGIGMSHSLACHLLSNT